MAYMYLTDTVKSVGGMRCHIFWTDAEKMLLTQDCDHMSPLSCLCKHSWPVMSSHAMYLKFQCFFNSILSSFPLAYEDQIHYTSKKPESPLQMSEALTAYGFQGLGTCVHFWHSL